MFLRGEEVSFSITTGRSSRIIRFFGHRNLTGNNNSLVISKVITFSSKT